MQWSIRSVRIRKQQYQYNNYIANYYHNGILCLIAKCSGHLILNSGSRIM